MLLLRASAAHLPLVPGDISDAQYEQLQTVRIKAKEFLDREDCQFGSAPAWTAFAKALREADMVRPRALFPADCCAAAIEPIAPLARKILERHGVDAPPEGQAPLRCAAISPRPYLAAPSRPPNASPGRCAHDSECASDAERASSLRLRCAKMATDGAAVKTLLFVGSNARNEEKVWSTLHEVGTQAVVLAPCGSCEGSAQSQAHAFTKPLHEAGWDEEPHVVNPDDLLAFNTTNTASETSVAAWTHVLRAFGFVPDGAAVRAALQQARVW